MGTHIRPQIKTSKALGLKMVGSIKEKTLICFRCLATSQTGDWELLAQQHEVLLGPFGSIVASLCRKGYSLFTANCLCQPTCPKANVDKYDVSNQAQVSLC